MSLSISEIPTGHDVGEDPQADRGSSASAHRFCKQDMLCFSHDWTGDPLSKTHIMRLLARQNRVLWVNSIGYRTPSVTSRRDVARAFRKVLAMTSRLHEVEKNIFVLNPIAIPFYGTTGAAINRFLLRWQVRRAMARLGFGSPINWVFNPAAANIAGQFHERAVLYYCVDEYTAFSGVAAENLARLERKLLENADLVIVSAEKLYASKSRLAKNKTILVRHGVDLAHFRKALEPSTQVPGEIASLPRPIIGFHGLIADWVDTTILAAIAKHFSSGSLVLIGKVTTDVASLKIIPNVHLLGRKPYADLPAYCKGFDVAINPFRLNELTLNANPLKVREYLAAGLPVVSTDIPEVRVLGGCRLAVNAASFIHEIEMALSIPGPEPERSLSMKRESWEARVDEITGHVMALPSRNSVKSLEKPI